MWVQAMSYVFTALASLITGFVLGTVINGGKND